MKIEHSAETDILYMEFQEGVAAETCDLDKNTVSEALAAVTEELTPHDYLDANLADYALRHKTFGLKCMI